jgi:hypothetical protein
MSSDRDSHKDSELQRDDLVGKFFFSFPFLTVCTN